MDKAAMKVQIYRIIRTWGNHQFCSPYSDNRDESEPGYSVLEPESFVGGGGDIIRLVDWPGQNKGDMRSNYSVDEPVVECFDPLQRRHHI